MKRLLGWILKRSGENSTHNGAAIVGTVLGIYFGPVQADLIISAVGTLWGAYQVIKSENN